MLDDDSSCSSSGPASSVAGELGSASKTKPGASLSVRLAVMVACTFVYSLIAVVLAAWVMVTFSPIPSLSCTAVTVTVWRVFQFEEVKVSDALSTVAAVVSPLVTATVTSAVGSADRRAV